ncbi:MAG: IS66 family transposase [Niameybacter sp.]
MKTPTTSNQNQTKYIHQLEEKCRSQEAKITMLTQRLDQLEELIRLSQHKQFGPSSEKTTFENQMSLVFNETEGFERDQLPEPTIEEITYKRKKSVGHKERILEDLPTETIIYELSEEEQVCPDCGETRHVMGKEVRRELKIIPARVEVVEYVQLIYSCRNCEKTGESVSIAKSTLPEPIIKGSIASPSTVSHIMTEKFIKGTPIYRQEQDFNRNGIELSRQTMSNWVNRSSLDWLQPLYEAFKKDLLERELLFADETTLQVLREPGKEATSKSYMWLYRTGDDGLDKPVVIYEYQPSRSAQHPKLFLSGYRGYLHVDGYEAYHKLPHNITICGCVAHARRKFEEALKSVPKEQQLGSQAAIGKSYCDKLFDIERGLSDIESSEKYTKRLALAKPVWDAYLAWLQKVNPLPKSALGKAVGYSLNQWKYLQNYLLDGRCELSNNRAERSIKPFVIGRKNFLFANTSRGAKASAITYSLIETAKENNLNPFEYLKYIFEQMPNVNFKENPEMLQNYMPWADLPEQCYSKKK